MSDGTDFSTTELHRLLQRAQDEISGHLETIRRQSAALGQTRRQDPEKRAREHELWDVAKRLFDLWRRKTGKTRCRFDAKRFHLVRPFLEADGLELCVKAVEGVAYDPFIPPKPRANGTFRKFNDWEQAFGDRGKFEEACNKAPFDARTLEEDLAEVEARR